MKKYIFVLLATVSLGITSCSPFQVKSDYSATANFTNYKTYLLRTDDLKLNDLDKDRVLNELSKQLQGKALTPGQNPDLIVNVKASHKKVKISKALWEWAGVGDDLGAGAVASEWETPGRTIITAELSSSTL